MLKTKRNVRLFMVMLLVIMAAAIAIASCLPSALNVSAAEAEENSVIETTEADTVQPRLFTQLELNLYGGNGEVWAMAENTFTLFPSTVQVYIYLYSSETFTAEYAEMTLETSSYTSDLNMGEQIEARASTDGEQRYWLGRIRYKIDGDDWKTMTSGPVLCNASGNAV